MKEVIAWSPVPEHNPLIQECGFSTAFMVKVAMTSTPNSVAHDWASKSTASAKFLKDNRQT